MQNFYYDQAQEREDDLWAEDGELVARRAEALREHEADRQAQDAMEQDAMEREATAKLTDMNKVGNFLFAGNAIFTLRSLKTGRHFTFRVAHKKGGDVSFVSLLTGSDNTRDYSYLGLLPDERATRLLGVGRGRSCAGADAPSALAFQFLLDCLWNRPELPASLEIWHEGRCGRCGRKLTVPESIADGIGPECATKI